MTHKSLVLPLFKFWSLVCCGGRPLFLPRRNLCQHTHEHGANPSKHAHFTLNVQQKDWHDHFMSRAMKSQVTNDFRHGQHQPAEHDNRTPHTAEPSSSTAHHSKAHGAQHRAQRRTTPSHSEERHQDTAKNDTKTRQNDRQRKQRKKRRRRQLENQENAQKSTERQGGQRRGDARGVFMAR